MENKCTKKSTMSQLQTLVEYMEANPGFARGCVTCGSNKMTMEEQWIALAKNINSLGPPVRSVNEWKKSWADLKSRTKKKIAENKKSLTENDGLYRMHNFTELEQIVERTLFLSKAEGPVGKVFGFSDGYGSNAVGSIDDCFIPLKDTPSRSSKAVAVINPSWQQQNWNGQEPPTLHTTEQPQPQSYSQQQKRQLEETDGEFPACSSAKCAKVNVEEKFSINHRHDHQSVGFSRDHVDAKKTLAEATKSLVSVMQRTAEALEEQAKAAKKNAETQAKILTVLEACMQHFVNK